MNNTRPNIHILCSPRSASTIISVALAQHPSLFLCPEMNLWSYSTLAEMLNHDKVEYCRMGIKSTITAGVVRVLCEINLKTPNENYNWLKQHQSWTTRQMENYINDLLLPYHPLYKSTRLPFSSTGLDQLVTTSKEVTFIHLIRHPISVINSLSQAFPLMINLDLHAKTWLHSNKKIISFLNRLPKEKYTVFRAEDILSNPSVYFDKIIRHAGYKITEEIKIAMMHPENSPFADSTQYLPEYYLDPDFIGSPNLFSIKNSESYFNKILENLSPEIRNELKKIGYYYNYSLNCLPHN